MNSIAQSVSCFREGIQSHTQSVVSKKKINHRVSQMFLKKEFHYTVSQLFLKGNFIVQSVSYV